ncbi:protein shisa-5-like isoform X1 [Carassius auratus]|uniref:Protein shisa-5 n=1 Tax=Carassius auratus TaxID=7957 RepID=A0A6P6N963_CARAU|nr:protein shisa-5-like isoform X1 [Carassius auratus]
MASASAVLLLLSAGLFTVTDGSGDDCESYFTGDNVYKPSSSCWFGTHCCGSCDLRYCCSSEYLRLSEHEQDMCTMRSTEDLAVPESPPLPEMYQGNRIDSIVIGSTLVGVVVLIVFFICCCCCCPCCCFYQMCRKPRPVVQTHVTTVVNTQSIQPQPVMQGGQYPQYQPVPTQPGYGGQPMQTAPYQGQSYAPGPPPSYHVAMNPGYPTTQGGQAMYPMQQPTQPVHAPMLSETSKQPAYNPAYMQPPNTGY